LTVAVAPNWTTNEDLLGYFNPFSGTYQETEFTRFLRQAAAEYRRHQDNPRPYHLILDELNLARVEYYFAKFLSAMETRQREGVATIELSSEDEAELTPNLYFIGTVNIDETTHGFADKVYDRGQLIELHAARDHIASHMGDRPYRETLMRIWDIVESTAPFAYRVIDEIDAYVEAATVLDVPWQDALDEQVLQKVLPKLKGAEPSVGQTLEHLAQVADEQGLSLTKDKIEAMLTKYRQHGLTSFF
jgi:hypothetical protein